MDPDYSNPIVIKIAKALAFDLHGDGHWKQYYQTAETVINVLCGIQTLPNYKETDD